MRQMHTTRKKTMFDIRRKKNGISDEKKIEQLYQTYKRDMFNTALSILRNRDDAQDAVY